MEIENLNNGGTQPTTPVEQESVVDTQIQQEEDVQTPVEKTFTKQEVVELMKKRVARSHNSFFKRYGVGNLEELDALFDKSNKYQSMQDEFGALQLKNSDLLRENTFLKNNINPEKYDDIVTYFRGKGIEFTEEALIQELVNHSEWLKPSNVPPTTTIKSLGAEAHIETQDEEKARASKLFGVQL